MCTSVWGCGRRREAPAKSQAEQRTEKWFILRLNYLSEQRLGKVTFCRDIFKMYLTMLRPHLLSPPPPTGTHIVILPAEWEYMTSHNLDFHPFTVATLC